MKKVCVLLLFLLLSLSLIVSVSAADYPSGWYSLSGADGLEISRFYLPEGVSVSLPDSVSLSPLEESVSFTVQPGIYTVGVDFPAGVYSVRSAEGFNLINIWIYDAKGNTLFSDGFWGDDGEFLGQFEFCDGYSVKLEDHPAYFSAPSGVVFD